MSTNVLPDKLSALIRVAVKDMQAAVAAGHLINMKYWVRPIEVYNEDGQCLPVEKCSVCMAGSVMLNTLGASASEASYAEWWGHDTTPKLLALNEVRLGKYRCALSELDESLDWTSPDLENVKAIEEEFDIFVAGDELNTDDKLRKFYGTMEQVATRLEQLGY